MILNQSFHLIISYYTTKMSRALQALRRRGLLAGLTHEHAPAILDAGILKFKQSSDKCCKPVAVYCGFDPTAESLHVGNLVTAMALRHFQLAGLKPIVLVGENYWWLLLLMYLLIYYDSRLVEQLV